MIDVLYLPCITNNNERFFYICSKRRYFPIESRKFLSVPTSLSIDFIKSAVSSRTTVKFNE